MNRWDHTLQIADVFHNHAMSLSEKRLTIASRIRAASFYDRHDDGLVAIVDDLAHAEGVEGFDDAWGDFYDWCDDHGVWVATR